MKPLSAPLPRVFIVEDEGIIVMDLRDRLSAMGYVVCGTSASGEQALLDIPPSRADVVLMDIHLAGRLTGVEAAARLRDVTDVPVVFLTAFDSPELLQQAGAVESFGYLIKPFEERELHATLQMALYKHRMEQQLRLANARLEDQVRARTLALQLANEQLQREARERSRAAAELQKSEHFVSATLDSLQAHVCVLDECGVILRTNLAWREFARENSHGLPPVGEGENYLDVCDAATGEGAQQAADFAAGIRAILSGEISGFSIEYPCHSPGRQRWFQATATRLVGEGPVRTVIAHEDITERKRVEADLREQSATLALTNEALRTSDARRREAQRLARLGHWSLDIESGDMQWCDETFNIAGRDPRMFRPCADNYLAEIVHPDDIEIVMQAYRRSVSGGGAYQADYRCRRADGRALWVHVEGVVEFDDAGRAVRMQGTVQDITERKAIEMEVRALNEHLEDVVAERTAGLLESKKRLRDFLDVSADWCFETDVELRFVDLSAGAQSTHVQQIASFAGRRPWEVEGTELSREQIDEIQALSDARLPLHNLEVRHFDARGRARWFSINAIPMFAADGSYSGYRGVATNITTRKEAEAARRDLEAQLRASQKMEAIGTLAGGIAHDFNNILGAILGNVALARRDVQASELAGALVSLSEIEKAGRRARDLVHQILAFSNKQQQELTVQPLRPLVEEALQMLRATLPATVSLVVKLGEEPLFVRTDSTSIGRMLVNLCTNAWQALPGGVGAVEVTLDASQLDDHVLEAAGASATGLCARLRVRDTGVGMDEGTAARVFEPFFTTKPSDQGTGLGLAVVHGIVKAHQGVIHLTTAPGAGTTFEILLPAQAAASGRLPEEQGIAAEDGRGQHILYVDDDAAMVFLVKRMLEKQGYRVSGYEDAAAALASLRDPATGPVGDFDLVVTDFNMPGASGLDVARELTLIRPGLPVVITSGYITDELRAGARAAGVRHLVYKPDTVTELCATIHRLLVTAGVAGRDGPASGA